MIYLIYILIVSRLYLAIFLHVQSHANRSPRSPNLIDAARRVNNFSNAFVLRRTLMMTTMIMPRLGSRIGNGNEDESPGFLGDDALSAITIIA